MKISFGKLKGTEIKDLPQYYLGWILRTIHPCTVSMNEYKEMLRIRKEYLQESSRYFGILKSKNRFDIWFRIFYFKLEIGIEKSSDIGSY